LSGADSSWFKKYLSTQFLLPFYYSEINNGLDANDLLKSGNDITFSLYDNYQLIWTYTYFELGAKPETMMKRLKEKFE
jgi:hypothetical protein